ncbi:TonB family protein [Pedobacter sp. SD-b]|uniref:TonB family protein n=2 Tax=Pedobacter segetis TaxID=2793069 RepID=A0ABS1BF45_9SPHI|nr:energy transducer TonB [Pedobacter segetis]MBK0381481.1 TonB family protein [Pedobacter segetis]
MRDTPFGNRETRVSVIDSADFTRTISITKNNENLYDVNEYYLDKTVKKIGNSTTDHFLPSYNGNVISYYHNGKKKSEEIFVKGVLKGESKYYYHNGALKKDVIFDIDDKQNRIEQIKEFKDSLGNNFLDAEATGAFKLIESNGNIIEGNYLKGYKDKEWKTVNKKLNVTYLDEYNSGKFVSGKTIDPEGKTTKYNELETFPTFNGGLSAFGSFLSHNLRYPSNAIDNNLQGRVYLQFVIEKDGALTDAKVIKGIGGGCDEEALRVINLSPKWNPGTQRGKPVRVNYTVPIFFQLQTSSPSRTKHFGSYR